MDATQRMKWYWAGGTTIALIGLVILLGIAGSLTRTTMPLSSISLSQIQS